MTESESKDGRSLFFFCKKPRNLEGNKAVKLEHYIINLPISME